MTDRPDQPAEGFTTIDAVERVMGAGYVASRESQQASELKRLKGVAHSLATVIDTAGAVVAEPRFRASCMSFANNACSMFRCERAGVGFLRARTVVLDAMSNTSRVERSTQLVRLIEEAMNEAVDQDAEIALPNPEDHPAIARMHEQLAREAHPCIVTLPLRVRDETVGALTLEREEPFTDPEIAAARMLCELVAPRLEQQRESDRWFGARLMSSMRRFGALVVGERYTWTKLGSLAGCALLVFALFVSGDHRVEAPCTLRARTSAVVTAPFDGRVRDVLADLGDEVDAGDGLLQLDDAELRLQIAGAEAELDRVLVELAKAQTERDLTRESEARLRVEQAQADLTLLNDRLERARLRSPIDGTVLQGRWRERVGAPVARGDTLFEIAPLEELRVDLFVDGRDIRHVEVGQRGSLATAAFPARRVGFSVERVAIAAQERDGANVFLVRATLDERPDWLRTGMQGAARVTVGQRRYAWLWTHRAVDWLRLRLWL